MTLSGGVVAALVPVRKGDSPGTGSGVRLGHFHARESLAKSLYRQNSEMILWGKAFLCHAKGLSLC